MYFHPFKIKNLVWNIPKDIMVKVEIRCPACSKVGKVEIEENIISQSVRGITAVNVAEFLVCEHSFVAYIDKNLAVRDCFVADFQIELPQIEQQEIERVDVPDSEVIDIYLICGKPF